MIAHMRGRTTGVIMEIQSNASNVKTNRKGRYPPCGDLSADSVIFITLRKEADESISDWSFYLHA